MIKNIINGIIATGIICYISYNLGKVNSEFSARKLQKSIAQILNETDSAIFPSNEELLSKIQQLKETAASNNKEIEKLKEENKKLINNLQTQKVEIEKIVKKILEMDLNTIFAKIKNDEKPHTFPDTPKEFIDILYSSIKNGNYNRVLELIKMLIELIIKANHDYVKVIR